LKILISGGYNNTGISLAERFAGEEHDVTVIDSFEGSENSHFTNKKIKFYNLLNSSPQCEKIFGMA
jgi:UDP-glucose 4-epimerase